MRIEAIVSSNNAEIDLLLKKLFNKQLFYPKTDDSYRLLRLRMWTERYSVSLSYVLQVLVPHFEKLGSKHRKAPTKGIGTTIPILTGSAAEAYLAECIAKEFPDGEHKLSYKQAQQSAYLCKLLPFPKKQKTILQYKTLAAYRAAYTSAITAANRTETALAKKLSKQPFRGNPFR